MPGSSPSAACLGAMIHTAAPTLTAKTVMATLTTPSSRDGDGCDGRVSAQGPILIDPLQLQQHIMDAGPALVRDP